MDYGEIWALGETSGSKIDEITFELLTKARVLGDRSGSKVTAVLEGRCTDNMLNSLFEYGADEVLHLETENLLEYNADVQVNILVEKLKDSRPKILLIGHTYVGMDLGPSVAARLGAPYAGGCMDVDFRDNEVSVVRPLFNGKVLAKYLLNTDSTVVVSLTRGSTKPSPKRIPGARVERIKVNLPGKGLRIKVVGTVEPLKGDVDLSQAEIIVAGGRGLGEKENYKLIRDLAEALGGSPGCSRPLVDMGWLPPSYQVGLSGKTVRPKLYVACGISGASQHLAGMRDSQVIVAINKDPKAPIFNVADYGAVGNVFEILPALTKEVLRVKNVDKG